jgi:hypothetical protein
MNSDAKENKDALKKELAETKDQERTTEVRQGKWLVHCNEAV